MKASNIVGMEVINLYEGQVDGYVKNLLFTKDYKKVNALIIYSDKLDKQFLLRVKNIYKINDVLFIKNSTAYSENNSFEDNSPINLPAYQSDGVDLGVITDAELDEKFNVSNFITSTKVVKNNIAKITNQLVIFNCENFEIKTYRFAPKVKEIKQQNTTITSNATPNTNNNFLVGRKVTKDIFSFNNELLVKAGTTVTERIVRIARLNGKLRELALNLQ